MAQDKLNGSADLLAKAMRQVFKEAVKEGTAPLRENMKAGFAEAAEERAQLRSDMENGFAELRPPK